MSHVATVKIEVRDLDALRAAARAIGLEFREGQRTYRWYGRFVGSGGRKAMVAAGLNPDKAGQCEHALAVPGAGAQTYEIGVVRKADGTYALAWDYWRGGFGLEAVAGPKCGNLVRAYASEVARKTLTRQGYRLAGTTVKADGTAELQFVKL